MEEKSDIRINTEIKQHREKTVIRKKGGGRLKGKVTLPSLEASMHVTPGAKGMAIVLPIKPIT